MSETLTCDHCQAVALRDTPDVRDWVRIERVRELHSGSLAWRERHFCSEQCLARWAEVRG